jgi:hypothetical protein
LSSDFAGIANGVEVHDEGSAGSDRGDIVSEIIAIVNEVARSGGRDPLDDGMPGGVGLENRRQGRAQPLPA